MTDALTYAVLQNIISPKFSERSAWENSRWTSYKPEWGLGTGETTKTVSDLLTQTTIKRACCKGEKDPNSPCPTCYKINVRIPTPKKYDYEDPEGTDKIPKKYGYIDKTVYIPPSMCKYGHCDPSYDDKKYKSTTPSDAKSLCQHGFTPKTDTNYTNCDRFYDTYCDQILADYIKINKITKDEIYQGKFPYPEFRKYKPECACYAPVPPVFKDFNIPPLCIMPGCTRKANAYFDIDSRESKGCDIKICNQTIDLSDFDAGHDVIVKVIANCGASKCGVTNCHICDPKDPSKCSTTGCRSGYTPNSDRSQCVEVECVDPNCLTGCDSVTKKGCTKCKPNFGLIGTDCKNCSDTNCSNCDGHTDKCITCMRGNYIDGDICKPCESGCKICTDGTTCTSCFDGYQKKNGKCVKKPSGLLYEYIGGGVLLSCSLLIIVIIVLYLLFFSGHKHRVVIHK